MPPRKDEEAESRKRGSADVELDGGGARRKGARTEAAAAAAATSAKTEENGGARAGRTKGLRVKLAGAGKCTRRGAEEESVAEEPVAEESVATPAAEAPAAEPVSGGSGGGGGGPAEAAAAKFQIGAVIILYNGSLRYEAEVLKASLSEPKKSTPPAKGARGRVASPGPSISYLVRYTKWPRRPEEWVGEAFAYQWEESLAKIVTNRPPRKQMWAEATGPAHALHNNPNPNPNPNPDPNPPHRTRTSRAPRAHRITRTLHLHCISSHCRWVESKAGAGADKAKPADGEGGGEASAAGDAAGEEAKGKSGRASAKGDAAGDAGDNAPGGRGQRGRKPTEKGAEKAASEAAAEMANMGAAPAEQDEDEGGLAMLMKLGRKATPKPEEEDEEGEEGDEDEEQGEDQGEEEEGEEEDEDEEGSDESDNEQAEQGNSNDDMSAGEDEDEDMIRIARERAAANEPQSMLMQMAEMTAEVPHPTAHGP